VTDERAIPEALARMRVTLERTRAVGQQLVGLNVHDANALAARSGCELREVKRDGTRLPVLSDFRTNRINIETEGGVVVEASPR
jgi:hypothetical protein